MHKYIFVACLLLVAIAVVTEAQQPIAGCGSVSSFPTDATKYVQVVNGKGIIRDCAVGTKYSEKTCSCSERAPVMTGFAAANTGAAASVPVRTQAWQQSPWQQSPWQQSPWQQSWQQPWQRQWGMWPFNWNDMMNFYIADHYFF